MKVEMFISTNYLPSKMAEITAQYMAKEKVLGNVYPMNSSVYNKKKDVYHEEGGVKIEIFDTSGEKLLALFHELKDFFKGVHCAWINTPDFNGCILNSSWYVDFCVSYGLIPEKCSEY